MNKRNICCLGGEDLGVLISVVIAVKCPEIKVTFADSDPKNIYKWNAKLMSDGINDPRLFEVLRKVQNKNLYFTTNESDSIREAEVLLIVSNPELKDVGEGKGLAMNLTPIADMAQVIADHSETDKVVVECSSIPLRSTECLREFFRYNAKPNTSLHVLSNPIFYDRKLGIKSAIYPDRVLIGHEESGDGSLAKQVLVNILERWINPAEIMVKNVKCVELAQIATYVLIAEKMATLCAFKLMFSKANRPFKKLIFVLENFSKIGGLPDINLNIGKFCKAIKNLFYICQEYNLTETIDYYKEVLRLFAFEEFSSLELMIQKIASSNLQVTLLGFAQEDALLPDLTNKICDFLFKQNVTVHIYDPKVTQRFVESSFQPLQKIYSTLGITSNVMVFDDPYKAAQDSQLVVIHSYREAWLKIDFRKIFEQMKKPAYLFDHFHLLQEKEIANIGFEIHDFFPKV